ncbi:MAG: phosphotransferase [Sulfurimonadaceae bacterium]
MGVKTALTLDQANQLFKAYDFEQIQPTADGIIDTTYIVENSTASYILKKFEEADAGQIEEERRLLQKFAHCQVNVPQHLCSAKDWHLYTRLRGQTLSSVSYVHLQTLARTLSLMHRCAHASTAKQQLFEKSKTTARLNSLKSKQYKHYRELRHLQHCRPKIDGVIHGDLFLDNVLFSHQHIGIIDFIDAGEGSFAFDLGVSALAWALRGSTLGYLRLFLQSYNQHAPRKITLKELMQEIEVAAAFYTLNRIEKNSGSLAHKKALLKKTRWLKRGKTW